MMQLGFFTEDNRLEKLSKLGDSLEKLHVINWEAFRPTLNIVFKKKRKSNAGRPPYDYLLLFKVLVLQRLFNLSDDQTEYQINDRMSFMRFLGLSLGDRVPDAKTIWLFRDTLMQADAIESLFHLFNRQLEQNGIITHTGTIVDATFVDAPRQRNTRDENKAIKSGAIPEEWQENTSKAAHKLSQKDTDARWTIKGGEKHYGYKDHVKVDADSKIIIDYAATDAAVHDSKEFVDFIGQSDRIVYADSAYSGQMIADALPQTVENRIHEKGYRNHPLTDNQKENNRIKSKVRVRIEHVFGFMTGSMNGITVRSIGKSRAEFNIGLTNLVYNLCRYSILKRQPCCMG
ncbi:MAG: IS5 family transposase [Oscillospiraceae bacterium]